MSNEIVVEQFSRAEDRTPSAPESPMAMVARAVQTGMDPATIAALMTLQERYDATEARKAFVVALNTFKANPPKIRKNAEVDFTSAKGRTHYKYSTLDNVTDTIGAALAAVGLSFRWDTEQLDGGLIVVHCVLSHIQGHSERVTLKASPDISGNKNSIQAIVSTVSYLQRQTLLSATGMAVQGTDDDARQGKANQMPEKALVDWLTAIEMCETNEQAEACWIQILAASKEAGDIEAHETMRAAMLARRKFIREKKT
jgi:hypothetical protein